MNEHLQPWYDGWLKEHEHTDLIYARGSDGPRLSQVHFVRDCIAQLFWSGVDFYDRPRAMPRYDCRETATVIGEHRSKSVRLPVYQLKRDDLGLRVTMRYNYHDWKLSVESATAVTADFSGLFHLAPPVDPGYTGNALSPVYFEGFPEDRIFGYYSENSHKFSAQLDSDESLWSVIFLLMRSAGAIRPLQWLTQKEHTRLLSEQSAKFNREIAESRALQDSYGIG